MAATGLLQLGSERRQPAAAAEQNRRHQERHGREHRCVCMGRETRVLVSVCVDIAVGAERSVSVCVCV